MRPAFRLATSSVFGRRSRSALLVGVVAMSAALIAAIATAMSSIDASLQKKMDGIVGASDVRVRSAGRATGSPDFPEGVAGTLSTLPEVKSALPLLEGTVTVRSVMPRWEKDAKGLWPRSIRTFSTSASAKSTGEGLDQTVRPIELVAGRLPKGPDEIVVSRIVLDRLQGQEGEAGRRSTRLSQITSGVLSSLSTAQLPPGVDPGPEQASGEAAAEELNRKATLELGGTLEVLRLMKSPLRFTIVGVTRPEILGSRPSVYLTLAGAQRALSAEGKIGQVDLVLREGVKPAEFVQKRGAQVAGMAEPPLTLQTTAAVAAKFNQNREATQMARVLAAVMASLAAGFIIMTGMSTNVTERQRELAILRCIGASPWQLAQAQVWSGILLGLAGAVVGVPLGCVVALSLLRYYQGDLKIDVVVPTWGLAIAGFGSVLSGLVGSVWPAWRAARMSPLAALQVRARAPHPRSVAVLAAVGLVLLLTHWLSAFAIADAELNFWVYIFLGLPCLFLGYFLLGVPMVAWLTRGLGGWISACWRLPATLLTRSVASTPYRFGFTAGAMMTGLAILVAVWTQGRSILNDWIGALEFPDVFVLGTNLGQQHRDRLEKLPFVTGTIPISKYAVDSDAAMGIKGLMSYKVNFIAFEPEPFFRLARLTFLDGDEKSAVKLLNAGGAVLVAKEFMISHGMHVGDSITLSNEGRSAQFKIAGVVTNPGLEIIQQFFDLPDSYEEQALRAVFGTQKDLRDKLLGHDAPAQMIQVGLKRFDPNSSDPGARVSDAEAERQIRAALTDTPVLAVGNGRKLKTDISAAISRSLLVLSAVAVTSMLVACFGVANLIVAGIDARQFEFGVIRAVGGSRGVVLRLVLAEATMIALASAILGTGMGLQAVAAGQHFDAIVLGIELHVRPPWDAIALGWAIVLAMTLGAAAPAVLALARKRPRELLGVVKG